MSRTFKYTAACVLALWMSPVFVLASSDLHPPAKFTHADAAVVLAKYSGFFERYVSEDASLNDCVGFLNKTGIYFGLMEVLSGAEFTQDDFARVSGQMALVFGGEAEYDGGKVKLPYGVASWKDYCIINDINFVEGYLGMLEKFQLLMGKQEE